MVRALLTLASLLGAVSAMAADDLQVLSSPIGGVAPKAMMHAYLLHRAEEALDRRDAEYEKLKTPEQLAAYQERMRQFFLDQLGGLPERTPLHPQIVGAEARDGYRVEKVIFESRPRHFVTAAFYLPEGKPPFPGVLVPCGHSDNGKAMESYQRASILLAKSGLAVLCYDPIDQGERFQLLDSQGKPKVGGTVAHCLVGVGSILLGRNTASFRVWDGMRALDYLASRPEVDPQRLGCAGNSGGGTLTSYLMALDPRILAAAPNCYLTSLRRLVETIGPQDAEQNIHGQIAFGMDHADYVLMRAPKPTLLGTATRDFFDIRGSWDTFRQAKRFYTRLGFPERVDLIEADQQHGFSSALRVATARWMRRWLGNVDDAITETESPILTDPQMRCTPHGQVMRLDGARNVYDINLDEERQLAAVRKRFWQTTPPAKALDEVRRITGIRALKDLPAMACENQGTVARNGYRIEKLLLKPEPGIWLPALALVPEKPAAEACLYIHASGKQADATPGGPLEKLVEEGRLVLAVDLRGLGETQGGSDSAYGKFLGPEWIDGYLAYLLGTSYLAMRTEDLLACGRFLATYQAEGKPRPVRLVSIGRTGPAALHAAALEPELFAHVTLRQSLASWSDVVATPLARNQMINVVHGVLRVYDLPDLAATLPGEKLTIEEPLNAVEEAVEK